MSTFHLIIDLEFYAKFIDLPLGCKKKLVYYFSYSCGLVIGPFIYYSMQEHRAKIFLVTCQYIDQDLSSVKHSFMYP